MSSKSLGFDKASRLAEDRRAALSAKEVPSLQPAFPHAAIPFDPEPFGAIPSDEVEVDPEEEQN